MVKIADFIEAPNSGGDYKKVLLVVHVTVSPETIGAARGVVANWRRIRNGSTQYVVDSREIIQAVRETAYAWAAGTTANKYGIHVEHCGYIQTIRQWRDGYSTAELELSAPLFAELAAKYGIPIRRLTVEQIRHAVKTGNPADGGICGHSDITAAFPGETTHTDPGASFPWDQFMGLVKAAAKPAPAPKPVERKATSSLRVVDWNVQKRRPGETVLAELRNLAATADVMTLQEVAGYRTLLDQIDGFHVQSFADDVAVLVRDGHEVKASCQLRVTSRGWFTVTGKRTGPKSAAACIVDGIGFASVHTPPTVQSALKRKASPRRWAAYRELMASMPAVVAHLGSRCVVAMDSNVDAATDKGMAGWPLATFKALGMRRHAPKDGTHGKRCIDYVFAKGASVGGVRVVAGNFGSDHRPITFTVHA